MGRNEIRIRRKPMSTGRIARFRDYERLMARHERDQRIRRLSRLIVYILIVVIMICTFLAFYIIHTNKPKPQNKHPREASISSTAALPENPNL